LEINLISTRWYRHCYQSLYTVLSWETKTEIIATKKGRKEKGEISPLDAEGRWE